MNSTWKTFGHDHVKAFLEKQGKRGLYPHAYLFSGPDGVGKKHLALELARKILGADNLSVHPDFKILDLEGEIGVETIRDFLSTMGYKPLFAKNRIALINNSHNLNTQASNALLKTLEEPPPHTIIILVGNAARHLPTIVSRCQVMNMQVFSTRQMNKYAKNEKIPHTDELIKLAFGLPSRLKRLSGDKKITDRELRYVKDWDEVKKSAIADRLIKINNFAEMEDVELSDLFSTWLYSAQQQLHVSPQNYSEVAALAESLKALGTNKNKKTILQSLFLKI